jgi:hypothetical protein
MATRTGRVRLRGLAMGETVPFFEMVRGGAEGWDASEPLRPVAS